MPPKKRTAPTKKSVRAADGSPARRTATTVTRDDSAGANLTGHVTGVLAESALKYKGLLMPSPKDPAKVAEEILEMFWTTGDGCRLVRHWMGYTYEWHTTHWEKMPNGHLEAVLLAMLRESLYTRQDGITARWSPSARSIHEVTQLITWSTMVHDKIPSGNWLDCHDGRCPIDEKGRRYISFSNCILDLQTMEQWKHSSAFFNTYSLHFPYDPAAKCPTWDKTLKQWFPNDPSARNAVEEVMAYLILGGLELDKIIVWLGKPRSGKGTIMRLVRSMLGTGFTTQSLDELADRFAMEDLMEKLVCHISEAATTRNARKVVQTLKSISGRDDGRTIKRKGRVSANDIDLHVKFVLTGNDSELELLDDSGVIADRVFGLWFGHSFLGHEDPDLDAKLAAEMSGIFNRILKAHAGLMERGRLEQPDSGRRIIDSIRKKAAPVKVWFEENYEVTKDSADVVNLDTMVECYLDEFGEGTTMRSAQMKIATMLGDNGLQSERVFVNGVRLSVVKGLAEIDRG